jgi:hypothetical protein
MKSHIRSWLTILLVGVLGFATSNARAQTQPFFVREIKLPVPHFRGYWFYRAIHSNAIFSIQLTPSNDLLIYGVDKNGKWPLVKVQRWWTSDPQTSVLSTPGFSGGDGENLEGLAANLEVTADGRYAVAVAGAEWALPKDGVLRPGEVISSVINLNQFQVQATRHFSDDVRLLNDKYLVLWGFEPSKNAATYQLLSIPGLEPGPSCSFIETAVQSASEFKKHELERRQRNDAACAEVLKLSGVASAEDLNAHMMAGRNQAPKVVSVTGSMNPASKDKETREIIATLGGRTYLLAVSAGETLRIYEVPSR